MKKIVIISVNAFPYFVTSIALNPLNLSVAPVYFYYRHRCVEGISVNNNIQ